MTGCIGTTPHALTGVLNDASSKVLRLVPYQPFEGKIA
jgi:hypothetical protein